MALPAKNNARRPGVLPRRPAALRWATLAIVFFAVFGPRPASAAECAITGPQVKLDIELVDWTLVIASGRNCTRGLRSGAMLVDSVTIGDPAKRGIAAVQGYGFTYRAPADFKGDDAFSVVIAGTDRGIRGASTLRVRVLVR